MEVHPYYNIDATGMSWPDSLSFMQDEGWDE